MWLVLAATPLSAQSQTTVMARAAAFVERYTRELPRLVATETMSQLIERRPGQAIQGEQRQSVSDLAWVVVGDVRETIGFRDVIEVDGRPVGAGSRRLVDLLHGPGGGTWADAREILNEGARYNLVPGSRNFNLPTVVVYFLQADRQTRFRWKRRSPDSAPVCEIEFHERSRPTVIRTGDGRSVTSRGRVWIDPTSGAVMRTTLELAFDHITYAIDTRLEYIASMGLVLPVGLDERYESPEGVVVVGQATYSNYRRFQTDARLVQ
jgi:hypothetical protein